MTGTPWVWPPVQQGGVRSVFGRTGVVVAQTDDYAASQISNDSTVSGTQVSDALDVLALGVSLAAANAGSNPYIVEPAVPNAFDDEFKNGSADLATRGYTVINAVTGVVQTRNGNIDPLGAAPPAGTYNSQIIGSWIYIQAPPGIQLDVYKTIALAAGDTYFVRMAGSFNLATAVNGRFNEIGLFGASGALLDNNNRTYTTVRDDTTATFLQYDAGRITGGGAFVGAGGKSALGGHDIRGVYTPSATNAMLISVDSQNGEVEATTVAGVAALATLTRFAVRNQFSTSGSAVPQIWGIDFIRKKTGGAWLIP